MALKIRTVMTYPLNGAVDFAITFEYLARKFVTVTLIGKDRKELVLNQDYRFTTKTQITTTRAWTEADGYRFIEIRRYTSATDRLVDFADGSILRAYDLNIAQIQTLHVAEEARDLTADTIGVNNDGNLDARGRKIVNVGEATEAGDAVNLGQLQKWNESALNSAIKAEQQATKAEQQANYAFSYADQAKSAQAAAAKSAADSQASNENSLEWSNRSESSAVRSQNSASESADSASLAKEWASGPKDSVVAGGLYSAYHYMLYSKSYMEGSQSSAITAKNEADRATVEANKLGNMNALAGAIDDVVGYDVVWKGHHSFLGNSNHLTLQRESDTTSSYIQGSYADGSPDWYLGKLGSGEVIQLSRRNAGSLDLTGSGYTALRHGDTQIKVAPGGIDYVAPAHTLEGAFRTRPTPGASSHTAYIGGVERNELRLITDGGGGSGHFVNALNGDWYDCWWKIGGVRGGSTNLPSVDIWVYNTGTSEARYSFNDNGTLSVSNGFRLTRDGDIWGSAYGNDFMTTWIKQNFTTQLVIGARSMHSIPGGWYDAIPPSGHILQGLNLNEGHGVHGAYYSPLWCATMSGARRIAVTE